MLACTRAALDNRRNDGTVAWDGAIEKMNRAVQEKYSNSYMFALGLAHTLQVRKAIRLACEERRIK